MHRALLALGAICGALACVATASAAVVTTDRDLTVEVQTGNYDPCTNANDLTVTFAGQTRLHVTTKYQGGIATAAHVDVSQSGFILTTIGGVDYLGVLDYGSKANLNNQNSVLAVHLSVAAFALNGTSALVFDVDERATFSASDPSTPVSAASRRTVASCPS